MAVTFDAHFQDGASAGATSFSFTSNAPASGVAGTVGSNSNRVLIGSLRGHSTKILMDSGAGVAMTWDGVAMTALGGIETPSIGNTIYLFGLIAPATGNKVLAASWGVGASGIDVSVGAVSVFSADQTTGWQNFTTNTGTSTTATVAVTSANGNMIVGGETDNDASSGSITAGTEDWQERDLSGNDMAAHNASSGASTSVTWTLGSSVAWALAGIDVIAAGAAAVADPDYGSIVFSRVRRF